MAIKWNKLNDDVRIARDGSFQIIKVDGEWRLLQKDEYASGGWEWCQTFPLLRDAWAAAEAIVAERETQYFDLLDPTTHHIAFE